jgi:hypothetical protein
MINTFSSLHSVSSLHTEHAAHCNMFFSLSSALSILQPRTVPSIIPPSPSELCSSTVAVLCIVVFCYVRQNSTLISNCLVVLKNIGFVCLVCRVFISVLVCMKKFDILISGCLVVSNKHRFCFVKQYNNIIVIYLFVWFIADLL